MRGSPRPWPSVPEPPLSFRIPANSIPDRPIRLLDSTTDERPAQRRPVDVAAPCGELAAAPRPCLRHSRRRDAHGRVARVHARDERPRSAASRWKTRLAAPAATPTSSWATPSATRRRPGDSKSWPRSCRRRSAGSRRRTCASAPCRGKSSRSLAPPSPARTARSSPSSPSATSTSTSTSSKAVQPSRRATLRRWRS